MNPCKRYLWLLLLLFPSILVRGRGWAGEDSLKELLAESDRLYFSRDLSGNQERCLSILEKGLKERGEDFDILWRLARILWWTAEGEANGKAKKGLAWKGYQYGIRAEELRPERIEGPMWGVVCLGEYSHGIGILTALTKGIEGKFRRMAGRAYSIDPTHTWGAPPRIWGRFYYELPWPKRDLKRSEKYLLESLRISPSTLRTRFYLAETLLALKREDDAKREIRMILKSGAKSDPEPVDGARVVKWARRLGKEVGYLGTLHPSGSRLTSTSKPFFRR